MQTEWQASDISNAIELPYSDLEFQDRTGEWHHFSIIATPERVVFGGTCNIGFLESGYIEREGFSIDECLVELVADLETYYNDGPGYVLGIVCNERM